MLGVGTAFGTHFCAWLQVGGPGRPPHTSPGSLDPWPSPPSRTDFSSSFSPEAETQQPRGTGQGWGSPLWGARTRRAGGTLAGPQ